MDLDTLSETSAAALRSDEIGARNWKRRMARIFISHSSRDNEAADRMKAWSASQGFENAFLDKDPTTGIPLGARTLRY